MGSSLFSQDFKLRCHWLHAKTTSTHYIKSNSSQWISLVWVDKNFKLMIFFTISGSVFERFWGEVFGFTPLPCWLRGTRKRNTRSLTGFSMTETHSTEDLGTTGPWSPSDLWGPGYSFSFSDSSDATFSGGPNAPWPRSGHSHNYYGSCC